MCGAFSIMSTSHICMSVPKATQGSRRRVLDRIYRINRIKLMEFAKKSSYEFQSESMFSYIFRWMSA